MDRPRRAFAATRLDEGADDPPAFRAISGRVRGLFLAATRLGAIAGAVRAVLRGTASGGLAARRLGSRRKEVPDVGWRLDAVGVRPGDLFFEGEAAAVAAPAFFGGRAAAGPALARERLAVALAPSRNRCGQGQAER